VKRKKRKEGKGVGERRGPEGGLFNFSDPED